MAALRPPDLLDLLEFWIIEPFDAALVEGRMAVEDYEEAVGPILDSIWPGASAGREIELPDGRVAVAPSWWDEAEYERGIATPDGVSPQVSSGEAARAVVESMWAVLREESKAES